MTDKQRKYIESLIKKVFRNADSQSEILSRLDRVKISSHQASVMIHAMKKETTTTKVSQVFQEWTHTISSLQSQTCQRIG